jgi:hypothetical protein
MSWLLVSCLQNVWPYFVAIEMLVSKIVYNLCRKHFPAFSSTLLKDRSTWGKVPTCIPHGSLCKPGSKINGLFCFSHCSLSLHFWWCLCSPKTLSHLVRRVFRMEPALFIPELRFCHFSILCRSCHSIHKDLCLFHIALS